MKTGMFELENEVVDLMIKPWCLRLCQRQKETESRNSLTFTSLFLYFYAIKQPRKFYVRKFCLRAS